MMVQLAGQKGKNNNKICGLVPYDTAHLIHKRPLFGIQRSLTFDLAIVPCIITLFYFFFYLLYSTGLTADWDTPGAPPPPPPG